MNSKYKIVFKNLIAFFTALCFLICSAPICGALADENIELFVATNGNDGNDGTIDSPLLTLKAARDKARELRGGDTDKNVIINIREGTYCLDETLELTSIDSASGNNYVIWQSYNNETVKIKGGKTVSGKEFIHVTDTSITKQIADKNARDKIYTYSLKNLGIEELPAPFLYGAYSYNKGYAGEKPTVPDIELFFNDEAMNIARYPNEGYLEVSEVFSQGDADNEGFKIQLDDDRPMYWLNAPEDSVLLHGYWFYDWADQTIPMYTFDLTNKSITSKWASHYGVKNGASFYVYNLLEELDWEGEYYIDRYSDDLNVYLYSEKDMDDAEITFSLMEDELIKLDKTTTNITLKGLDISASRNSAVVVEGQNCNIYNCEISNTASCAVKIGGYNNTVFDCYIHGVNEGVSLGGGSIRNLTPSNNRVINCEIARFARLTQTYTVAVRFNGVGAMAAFNEIHDAPHIAIMFEGNNNKIYYNNIYDVLKRCDDAGAIYGGQSWTTLGLEIKYNYIHDLSTDEDISGVGVFGVFLDGGQCDVLIEGNIFADINGQCVFVSGGHNNIVKNNCAINTKEFYRINQYMSVDKLQNFHHANLDLWSRAYGILNENSPWRTEYPKLYEMLELTDEEKLVPSGNVLENNYCYGAKLIFEQSDYLEEVSTGQNLEIENNGENAADSGFISLGDAENAPDYTLKDNAEVFSELPDFHKLPFDCMGIQGSMACLEGNGFFTEKIGTTDVFCLCRETKENINATLICVCYDCTSETKVLKSIQTERVQAKQGKKLHGMIKCENNKGYTSRCLLWNTITLAPLFDGYSETK